MAKETDPQALANGRMLRYFYEAARIPVTLFSGDALLTRFSDAANDLNLPLLLRSSLPKDLPTAWYAATEDSLIFGGICMPEDSPGSLLIFLGPVLPFECSAGLGRALIDQFGYRPSDTGALLQYLNESGLHNEQSIRASLMVLMRLFVFFSEPLPEPVKLAYHWNSPLPAHRTVPASDTFGQTYQNDRQLERRLLSYVRHGITRPFEEMLEDVPGYLGIPMVPGINPLMRQYTLTALTLASRTAMNAGVDPDLATLLLQQYMDELTQTRSPETFSKIFPRAFLSFAREVQQVNGLSSPDPLVRKVHSYIRGHIYEKLTPTILARELGYNTSYLCAHFREHMGKTISTHVNECKIEEACHLLELPDADLTEIAIHLGYPSQSYFCTVFKKVKQMTPGAYRAAAGNL